MSLVPGSALRHFWISIRDLVKDLEVLPPEHAIKQNSLDPISRVRMRWHETLGVLGCLHSYAGVTMKSLLRGIPRMQFDATVCKE